MNRVIAANSHKQCFCNFFSITFFREIACHDVCSERCFQTFYFCDLVVWDKVIFFSIVFNIYGGSNQILPNATSATQNYYGDEAELEKDDVSKDKELALSPEAMRLFSYINKVEDLRIYLVQIAECTNAVELARVIVKMGEREPKITSEEMVKERFISLFFPLTPLFVSGKTVSNIRARINNAWARRPRKRL